MTVVRKQCNDVQAIKVVDNDAKKRKRKGKDEKAKEEIRS